MTASEPLPVERDELHRLVLDEHYAVYRWRNVVLNAWMTDVDPGRVARLIELQLKVCEETQTFGAITFVTATCRPPGSEARRLLAESARDGRHVRYSATIFEGSTLRTTAFRSIASGMAMIAKPGFPTSYHRSILDMAGWLEQQDPTVARDVWVAIAERFRSELAGTPARG